MRLSQPSRPSPAIWKFLGGLLLATAAPAWQPGTSNPTAVAQFTVNAQNRRDVLAFYQCVYKASEGFASRMAWNGDVAACVPGTTSSVFKDDVRRRVNFYRALCGLPADITFNTTNSSKAQEAALMMSANNALSHYPPNTWLCYTANGADAADSSNLALGNYGPDAINAYIRDNGSNNRPVGHRRWILFSRAQEMGTGDIPANNGKPSSNALWVIGNFKAAPAAAFVSWPNAGFVPAPLVPARWSLSYPGASFGSATVTMSKNGSNVPVTIVSNTDTGIGDNSIVWEPSGLPSSVTNDETYTVTVSGIGGGGPASKSYSVTIFNPDILGDAVAISGAGSSTTAGKAYIFNSIDQADTYELEVNRGSRAAWTEGAEDAPAPRISEAISPGYSLRQANLVRTGAKAFQLTYPSGVFSDQSFTITRNLIPSATSTLSYYDRARFSVTSNTLEAQVSTDDGSTWTTVVSRNGVGLSSASWDSNWIPRSASLAAYAGQAIQLRFILKRNGGSVSQGTDQNMGFFLDDISVSNAIQLVNSKTSTLAGSATSFRLDATTAGAPLIDGSVYYMRIRPNVGCQWFPFGAIKTVNVQDPVFVQHTISLSATPATWGTVSGGGTFNEGTSQTVTAASQPGYRFLNWTEGCTVVSRNASYTFNLTSDRNLVANFRIARVLTLSKSPTTGGAVTGGGVYASGSPVTTMATPNIDHRFVNWSEGGTAVSTNASYAFNLTANRTLVANFRKKVYPVAITPSSGGTVTTNATSVPSGNNLAFTARPAAGFIVKHWLVNGQITQIGGNTLVVKTIRSRVTVMAVFDIPANDLDRNARNDLLWQYQPTGKLQYWSMFNKQRLAIRNLNPSPASAVWQLVGCDDFNGDAYNDIILQNQSTGDIDLWYFRNGQRISGGGLLNRQPGSANWRAVATGDFNNDGKTDIVLQNVSTAATRIWLLNQARQVTGITNFMNSLANPMWRLSAAGDVDKDGKADLIWQYLPTGQINVWLMDGRRRLQSRVLNVQPGSGDWRVAALADFNQDSRDDIILQNIATGKIMVWYLNGSIVTQGGLFPNQPANTGWEVRNSRTW